MAAGRFSRTPILRLLFGLALIAFGRSAGMGLLGYGGNEWWGGHPRRR